MDLRPVTSRSFVVQWSAKIAGRRSQLKPLVRGNSCEQHGSGNYTQSYLQKDKL